MSHDNNNIDYKNHLIVTKNTESNNSINYNNCAYQSNKELDDNTINVHATKLIDVNLEDVNLKDTISKEEIHEDTISKEEIQEDLDEYSEDDYYEEDFTDDTSISSKASIVINYLKNKYHIIKYKEILNHDGYDRYGPQSNFWDLYVIIKKNNKYRLLNFHWEDWFCRSKKPKGYIYKPTIYKLNTDEKDSYLAERYSIYNWWWKNKHTL